MQAPERIQHPQEERWHSKKQDMAFSKNTYYRFLNKPGYNWQRFLTLLSARVIAYFSFLTHRERVKCLVLDDSVIERNRSKQVELLSWIYNHVIHRMIRGFNMLTLGWTDGYSFVPATFNMMASIQQGRECIWLYHGNNKKVQHSCKDCICQEQSGRIHHPADGRLQSQ